MPFLGSRSTLKRLIAQLQELRILIVANFNKKSYDLTQWYRIDYDRLKAVVKMNTPPVQNERPPVQNERPPVQNEPTYTRDFPETSTKTSTKTTSTRAREEFFEEPDPPPRDPSPKNQDSLIAEMMALDSPNGSPLSRNQAQKLLQQYGPTACRNQLDWLPCRNPHNAVAIFQSALKNILPAPKTWQDHQAEIARRKSAEEQAARLRAQRDAQREEEREIRAKMDAQRAVFAALSPAEKQAFLEERDRKHRENNPMTLSKVSTLMKFLPEFRAAVLAKMPPGERAEILAKLPPEMQQEFLERQVSNLNTCSTEAAA